MQSSFNPTVFIASQDETLRLWTSTETEEDDGEKIIHKCVLEILCNCPVSVLAIDHQSDVLLAALDSNIHIYDVESGKLLQVKYGHAENIRCILPVPERRQYRTLQLLVETRISE